jgi:hypothetical protein
VDYTALDEKLRKEKPNTTEPSSSSSSSSTGV